MTDLFKDKTVVITGGSKGLGLVCTDMLAGEGCHVVVLSRSQGELPKLQERFPDRITWIKTDMADCESVSQAFAQLGKICSRLDGLVLNAALTSPCAFEELTETDIISNLMVNVAGPIYCLQKAAPLLQGGRAIFVSSESVASPFPMLELYASVKAAVENLFSGLRRELYSTRQIQLSVVRAGSMAGTAFSESWSPEKVQEFYKTAVASGCLNESGTPMPPENVARGIVQLLAMGSEATINMMDIRSADAF